LLEVLAQLKHDLGKYIAFQSRWLVEDEPLEGLRSAVVADLCETQRGPAGARSAVEIWRNQRGPLEALWLKRFGEAEPEWLALVSALEGIERTLPLLLTADADALWAARQEALLVSDLISAMHRRVRNLTPVP
jgi:hypothetical protein